MAGSAGRLAVAAKLHFPEECFAQSDGRILVLNQVGKFSRRWPRDSDGLQRSKATAVVTAAAISAFATATPAVCAATTAAISTFAAAGSATIIAATPACIATATVPAFAFLSAGLDAAISASSALSAITVVLT